MLTLNSYTTCPAYYEGPFCSPQCALSASIHWGFCELLKRRVPPLKERPEQHKSGRRPKMVVLGTGWGSVTFLQGLSDDIAKYYDITVAFWLHHILKQAKKEGENGEKVP